jgi:hypothetical protein
MASVGAKLNLKPGHAVYLAGVPDDVDLELPDGSSVADDPESADAVIAFVASKGDVAKVEDVVLPAARRDAVAWVAYPKGGQLGTDLNRDILAALLEERGIKAVRQVSVDDVWSALRFRPA